MRYKMVLTVIAMMAFLPGCSAWREDNIRKETASHAGYSIPVLKGEEISSIDAVFTGPGGEKKSVTLDGEDEIHAVMNLMAGWFVCPPEMAVQGTHADNTLRVDLHVRPDAVPKHGSEVYTYIKSLEEDDEVVRRLFYGKEETPEAEGGYDGYLTSWSWMQEEQDRDAYDDYASGLSWQQKEQNLKDYGSYDLSLSWTQKEQGRETEKTEGTADDSLEGYLGKKMEHVTVIYRAGQDKESSPAVSRVGEDDGKWDSAPDPGAWSWEEEAWDPFAE